MPALEVLDRDITVYSPGPNKVARFERQFPRIGDLKLFGKSERSPLRGPGSR
jgi:hypothetical protein